MDRSSVAMIRVESRIASVLGFFRFSAAMAALVADLLRRDNEEDDERLRTGKESGVAEDEGALVGDDWECSMLFIDISEVVFTFRTVSPSSAVSNPLSSSIASATASSSRA